MTNILPKISIITPSYNQGEFIEETILSVIMQHYPNIEYIIIDGGSNDNSIEIIKKYEKYIAFWISEKDSGQTEAINKGLQKATGEIIAWLNSDDIYLPGALYFVANTLLLEKPEILFGNAFHLKETTGQVWGSNVINAYNTHKLEIVDFVIQPSSFWNRKVLDINGFLDTQLNYAFDWEWFLRAKKNSIDLKPIQKYLSVYRIHTTNKSLTGSRKRQSELFQVFDKYNDAKSIELRKWLLNSKVKREKTNRAINMLGLNKVKPTIFKFLFPQFRDYDTNELYLIQKMLGIE